MRRMLLTVSVSFVVMASTGMAWFLSSTFPKDAGFVEVAIRDQVLPTKKATSPDKAKDSAPNNVSAPPEPSPSGKITEP